jgi:hypothetical protein
MAPYFRQFPDMEPGYANLWRVFNRMNRLIALCFTGIALFTGCVMTRIYGLNPTGLTYSIYEAFSDDTELVVDFTRYPGNILFTPKIYIRTEQPRNILQIREISFTRNEKKYYFLKNKKIKIPDMIIGDDGRYYDYIFDLGITANVSSRFRDMEIDDSIEIDVLCVYIFDEEPLKEKWYKYTVRCNPGRTEIPWFILQWIP